MSASARSRRAPCRSCATPPPTRAPATCWRCDALRHQLTPTWSVELPDDGEGTITDEGELAVAAPGRSIVLATWEADGSDPVDVIDGLRSQERPPPREEYREDGPEGTRRWAVLLDEEDEGRRYHGLYGYVLSSAEWLQVAVLFDDEADLPEALHVWRSVRHADG